MEDKIINACTHGAITGFAVSIAQVGQLVQIGAGLASITLGVIGLYTWLHKRFGAKGRRRVKRTRRSNHRVD